MAEKMYTEKELQRADRLANIIASVPADKQEAFARFMEAVIIGVELGQKAAAPRV